MLQPRAAVHRSLLITNGIYVCAHASSCYSSVLLYTRVLKASCNFCAKSHERGMEYIMWSVCAIGILCICVRMRGCMRPIICKWMQLRTHSCTYDHAITQGHQKQIGFSDCVGRYDCI